MEVAAALWDRERKVTRMPRKRTREQREATERASRTIAAGRKKTETKAGVAKKPRPVPKVKMPDYLSEYQPGDSVPPGIFYRAKETYSEADGVESGACDAVRFSLKLQSLK